LWTDAKDNALVADILPASVIASCVSVSHVENWRL
jgi:hypothetical protein